MSDRILAGLEPERVFYYFEEISKIPRPSYHEKAISDYLVSFAKEHGLEYYQDELYNVIIIKEAAKGRESDEPIILQGHMDMVCEKDADCNKDMEKEGLELYIDGDWLKAKGTTLGGDDGVAVAFALALLEDEALNAPRLEFICTVSEETGMEGAHGIDLSPIRGRMMLNLDSENEGEVLASCAGGGRLSVKLPIEREDLSSYVEAEIIISKLQGGHSGAEIDKGRANADILMARVLRSILQEKPIRLVDFAGGTKDNAICRYARSVIAFDEADGDYIRGIINKQLKSIKDVYSKADPDVEITFNCIDKRDAPITEADTENLVRLMLAMPNGVIRMSDKIEGLVETSLNLGILYMDEDFLHISYSLRSSVAAAYDALRENMRFMADGYGASTRARAEYPAWEYVENSPLRERLKTVYNDMYGKELKVTAIHAGVECGILADKIAGLDAVSMGPDMCDIHTPAERLSISSVKRTYEFVKNIICG